MKEKWQCKVISVRECVRGLLMYQQLPGDNDGNQGSRWHIFPIWWPVSYSSFTRTEFWRSWQIRL